MKRAITTLACALGCAAPFACQPDLVVERCSGIPAGGCPKSRANACDDPACEAIYACTTGSTWSLDHACPPREAGVDSAPVRDSGPVVRDAAIDAPPGAWGGPGCIDLLPPDCSLGRVLDCPAGSCCGCEDLFVCEAGGWRLWGTCEGGNPLARDR